MRTRVILFSMFLGGCSCASTTPGGSPGDGCDTTADCMGGLTCIGGECVDTRADGSPFFDGGPGVDVPTGCGEFDFPVTAEPGDLVLVVDRSTSMEDDITRGTSKWDALLTAVDSVTHTLEASLHFGLSTYPAPGGGGGLSCDPGDVLIDPDVNNADAIMMRLNRDGTGGATPTAPTLEAVGSYLRVPRSGHETHTPAILLATDGAPNCNGDLDPGSCTCSTGGGGGGCRDALFCLDDAGAYAAIDAAAGGDPSIPVYVIGLPGSEAFADVLSEMARRGGTARSGDPAYFAADDGAALEAALLEIAGGLVSCVFSMDIAPENPRQVRIIVDGMDVPHTDDMSDGWAYTNPSNTQLELFGSWCDRVTDGGSHTVTASYACTELF